MADVNSINFVFLVGRVSGDIHYDTGKGASSDINLIRFWMATNEAFQGSRNQVQFHSMVAFGAKADLLHKYCKKGMLLAIKGKLRNSQWQDQQGNKRKTTQINIEEITFLGKKEDYDPL